MMGVREGLEAVPRTAESPTAAQHYFRFVRNFPADGSPKLN